MDLSILFILISLAPAHSTKGVIHSVDGHRSVYRQICKEWNEIESGSFETVHSDLRTDTRRRVLV